ncbi:beta-galactosidase [Murimonas intestini]|uniref:beta-galactosidase n=1 Tax=Murimonas intestini TaxID=1337051 RepID=UPI00248B2336|nr:beta-galactosidase [Murimonas intestini]
MLERAESTINITDKGRASVLHSMSGKDSRGNLYEADNVSFIKNGKRFIPVMGEYHFSRYEPEGWKEELLKMKAGGVNIVSTYVFWIHHEEKEGVWDFEGCRNLRAFLFACKETGMSVWLRIGPWVHGECRNGGFPDWLVRDTSPVRIDAPIYLERVRRFWEKTAEQAEGMMCKDGGPILGIQLENEYGHCGGQISYSAGMAHMRTLKKMAREAGFVVPYYTATGWGEAYVPDDEMLPVLGCYADAPWAGHVEEMPANANFLFTSYKKDENIGSDWKKNEESKSTFDLKKCPYLTAELGAGLQVTSHRRTYPWPEDIEAQALCVLGSGANMLGYYMYHGGINPDGKYSTLQESRATGYSNDLPVKSYDCQTCIRESGEINKSYGRLKKLHLLLDSFGEILAGADAYFPEEQPEAAEDCHTLRVCARVNHKAGAGFLFINNHQRKRHMDDHEDCNIRLILDGKEIILHHITVKDHDCGIIPFLLPQNDSEGSPAEREAVSLLPYETNAFLLCRIKDRLFFYTDLEKTWFLPETGRSGHVVLTSGQAERAFMFGDKLYITERADSCIVSENGHLYLITKAEQEMVTVYGECGEPEQIQVKNNGIEIPVKIERLGQDNETDSSLEYVDYLVKIDKDQKISPWQLYLEADYLGDRAEAYIDGRLVDDWFTTGEKWHISLKRFGYPEVMTLRIYPSNKTLPNPYGNKVYYDLPVREGCEIMEVKALPEYKSEIILHIFR